MQGQKKKKKKSLVSRNPTLIFFGHLRMFLLFLWYFEWFSCLPTEAQKYWDVSGNKTFIFFWPKEKSSNRQCMMIMYGTFYIGFDIIWILFWWHLMPNFAKSDGGRSQTSISLKLCMIVVPLWQIVTLLTKFKPNPQNHQTTLSIPYHNYLSFSSSISAKPLYLSVTVFTSSLTELGPWSSSCNKSRKLLFIWLGNMYM